MKTEITVSGAREILHAMRQLPARLDRPLLNKGLLAGAALVRDEARQRAPVLAEFFNRRRRPGTLRRAISSYAVRPDGYAATVFITVRGLGVKKIEAFKRGQAARGLKVKGADNPNDPFYWKFVEFGTSKMAARPFLRPAFESRKEQGVKEVILRLRPLVQAEINKLGRL